MYYFLFFSHSTSILVILTWFIYQVSIRKHIVLFLTFLFCVLIRCAKPPPKTIRICFMLTQKRKKENTSTLIIWLLAQNIFKKEVLIAYRWLVKGTLGLCWVLNCDLLVLRSRDFRSVWIEASFFFLGAPRVSLN